jgi:5'-nucleotidase
VAGLSFLDEAETANRWIAALQVRGVHAFVVLLHQGGRQAPYAGPTRVEPGGTDLAEVEKIVSRLDGDVDVVITGHSHSFTDAFLPNKGGKAVLVTQSFSTGSAYGRLDLTLSPASGEVVAATASVERTWGDAGPGLAPDPAAAVLVAAATERVAPIISEVVGQAPVTLRRRADAAGESQLGDLVTDAQLRFVPGAQVAISNPGGLRADLSAGPVTWGALFAVQPFNNDLVAMDLTGAELLRLLEQQWQGEDKTRLLQVSGLRFTWSRAARPGARVSQVAVGGAPLDPRATYRVVVNAFLASGGDGFTVLADGRRRAVMGQDLDALVRYVKGLPGRRIVPPPGRRITVTK